HAGHGGAATGIESVQRRFRHAVARCLHRNPPMEPFMNRSALLVLSAAATVAMSAEAHTYTDNARVIGVEAQYENVSVPRQECRSDWVSEARPVGRRDYGGA